VGCSKEKWLEEKKNKDIDKFCLVIGGKGHCAQYGWGNGVYVV